MLTHGVRVVAGEVPRDTNQPGFAPQHLGRGRYPEPVAYQALECFLVGHEPRYVVQALIDDARVGATLVLNFTDRRST